jgi:hypothetical protein
MKDESTNRNKEVIAKRDDESTNEYDDEYTSEKNCSEPSDLDTPR